MATLEEIQEEVRAEVELEKPLQKSIDGVVMDLDDNDYEQLIIDRADARYDIQQNGWIEDRLQAYGSWQQQLDMIYWDGVNGTTTWADHIAEVKANNPKPT